jgi:hypothetical protein
MMENSRMNYTDCLKAQVYEDFLESLASVRAGANPEVAFREHEERVRHLRMKVAAAEAGQVRPGVTLSLVA